MNQNHIWPLPALEVNRAPVDRVDTGLVQAQLFALGVNQLAAQPVHEYVVHCFFHLSHCVVVWFFLTSLSATR